MNKEHLILRLEAPMMSFGNESVDSARSTGEYPGLSLVTGLLANALGWRRTQPDLHQELESRLVIACRVDRPRRDEEPGRLTDLQTASMQRRQEGWTTRGVPEARTGGEYQQDMMLKDYHSDRCVTVALRLEPAVQPGQVSLAHLREALTRPYRPLFIGRKGCLPSGPILRQTQQAETAAGALLAAPLPASASPGPQETGQETLAMTWPHGEGDSRVPSAGTLPVRQTRNWNMNLHSGITIIHQGHCPLSLLAREETSWPPTQANRETASETQGGSPPRGEEQ